MTAPALPPGWTTSFSGSGTAWTTSTALSPPSAPNAAFGTEAAAVGLSEITSPAFPVSGPGTKVTFRNQFNTEATYDGMVLEISIPTVNGGAFQDILTAGGSFVTGGYNSTLDTGFSNPLPGRMAWSGLSGGTAEAPAYITTIVTLPAAAAGQNIRLKWRVGSDSGTVPSTNPGVRIDNVTASSPVCGGSAPPVFSAVSRRLHGGAGIYDINLPLTALGGAIGVESRTGAHQLIVTFTSPVTVGGIAVASGTATPAFTVAGAVVTINLTGVPDVQRLGITLENVSSGANLGNVLIPMGVLAGDTNGNGAVTGTDVSQTKAAASSGAVGPGTFRTDAVANGTINATDIGLVKSKSGNVLPP